MTVSNPKTPPGWVGGFAQSNPAFAYPHPDFHTLELPDNMKYIDKLQRQWAVLWPEFSWETQQGAADPKRCYQMFAPDISRLGYTDTGRVYSIICPQQGACSSTIGCMNVEVTVTGNRGWANEDNRELACDVRVKPKIWFTPMTGKQNWLVKRLWKRFAESNRPFPSDKQSAIELYTCLPGNPKQAIFPLIRGQSSDFPIPKFALHDDVAFTVGNLAVQIGAPDKTGDPVVDEFNELVMDAFNLASGNMLAEGNILTWNVWFNTPEIVDQEEWRNHAIKWRDSIDADHGSPDGEGSIPRYFDGKPFKPGKALVDREEGKFMKFLEKHFGGGV